MRQGGAEQRAGKSWFASQDPVRIKMDRRQCGCSFVLNMILLSGLLVAIATSLLFNFRCHYVDGVRCEFVPSSRAIALASCMCNPASSGPDLYCAFLHRAFSPLVNVLVDCERYRMWIDRRVDNKSVRRPLYANTQYSEDAH